MPISKPNSGTSHILSDNRRIDDLEERSCVEIGLKDESLTDMYRADELCGTEALATVEEHKVWNSLPETEFMQQYGNKVMEQYNIPTQQELDEIAAYDADNSDSSSDEGDNEDEDGGEE